MGRFVVVYFDDIQIFRPSWVGFLGYVVSKDGLSVDESKVELSRIGPSQLMFMKFGVFTCILLPLFYSKFQYYYGPYGPDN